MESPDFDKDRLIQQQQQEIEELKIRLKKYTNPSKSKKYYENNRERIRAQQNEYKHKIRQKSTVKEST